MSMSILIPSSFMNQGSRKKKKKNPNRILCLCGNLQATFTIYIEMQRTKNRQIFEI